MHSAARQHSCSQFHACRDFDYVHNQPHRPATLALLSFIATAPAQDPTPPPGGFPITLLANNPITYSDGYRTMLDIRYPDVAAPNRGWPGAMIVHGGGGSRTKGWVVANAERLTRAGYSGRNLPVASALVTKMPTLLAAHSDIQVLDAIADKLPGGNLLQAEWMVGTVRALGPTDPLSVMLLNRNYAGLRAYLASAYLNADSQWKHRHSRTWPIAPNKRFYLRTGGRLTATAPAAVEAGPTLRHRVAAGYNPLGFVADDGKPSVVTTKIPLVQATFDTSAMRQPHELLGRSVVELELAFSGGSEFQLSAALLDVPPTGSPRFITSGVAARRQISAGVHRVKITLDDVGYVVRSGHRLRISLENLHIRRQPSNPYFYSAPEFHDYNLGVSINPNFPPRVDLPLEPARASLTPRIFRVRGTSGLRHTLNFHGESSRAGEIYQVFLGASGAWPGLNVPPRVPLNVDVFTSIAASLVNTPWFANFLGQLDAQGRAQMVVTLPAPVAADTVGMRFTFVGISVDGSNQYSVTNPTELLVEK